MFDTRIIGQKIAALRKAKDLTQTELADQLLVSYQAVSNWERGNSMPDISKLADLCRILGVGMEELLGDQPETAILHKVAEDETIGLNEVAKVAPVLKPSQMENLLDNAPDEQIAVETLYAMAPYLSSKRLLELAKRSHLDEISQVVPLAPFLDGADLMTWVHAREDLKGNLAELVPLAPFIEGDSLKNLILRQLQTEEDTHALVMLAPFLDEEALDEILASLPEEKRSATLPALAPFLKSSSLNKLAGDLVKNGNMKLLKQLLPFLDGNLF